MALADGEVLIIGGGGFIGTNFIRAFGEPNSHKISVISTKGFPKQVKNLTVASIEKMTKFQKYPLIINLAQRRNPKSFSESRSYNTDLPVKFISKFASSDTLVLNFSTYLQHYKISKDSKLFNYQQDKILLSNLLNDAAEKKNFQLLDVNLFTVFGQGDYSNSFISQLIYSLKSKTQFKSSKGDQLIALTHVGDVVKFMIKVYDRKIDLTEGQYSLWPTPVQSLKTTITSLQLPDNFMDWGCLPYAGHELFEDTISFPPQVMNVQYSNFVEKFYELIV
jgi:nucleoside-diphosphate-sugar epimerase